LLVMVPALEREYPIAHNVFGLSPLVTVFLYTGAVRWRRSGKGHEGRKVAAWPFERELQSQIVLRLYAQLCQVFDLSLVDFLGVFEVIEKAHIIGGHSRIEFALVRPHKVAGCHRI